MLKAGIIADANSEVGVNKCSNFWDEANIDMHGLSRYRLEFDEITRKKKECCIFKAWFQDWKKDTTNNYHLVVKQQFLSKYSGLLFIEVYGKIDRVVTLTLMI